MAKKMTMAELKVSLEEQAQQYNAALLNDDFKAAKEINKSMQDDVVEYANQARKHCFDALAATENPMLSAVRMLTFNALRIKDTTDSETDVVTRSIETVVKPIDLRALHKSVKGGVGAEKDWRAKVEYVNFLLTAKAAEDMGIDPTEINDSYLMSNIAQGIRDAANAATKGTKKPKNPISNTSIVEAMNAALRAMLGDGYKATSHHLEFLVRVQARKSKRALTVACAGHNKFCGYFAEIAHGIVLEKPFAIEYKKAEK